MTIIIDTLFIDFFLLRKLSPDPYSDHFYNISTDIRTRKSYITIRYASLTESSYSVVNRGMIIAIRSVLNVFELFIDSFYIHTDV